MPWVAGAWSSSGPFLSLGPVSYDPCASTAYGAGSGTVRLRRLREEGVDVTGDEEADLHRHVPPRARNSAGAGRRSQDNQDDAGRLDTGRPGRYLRAPSHQLSVAGGVTSSSGPFLLSGCGPSRSE